MARIYRFINASSASDGRLKVTVNDTTSDFLDEKLVVAASNKLTKTVLNSGFNEDLELDVDETNIDHNILLNYRTEEHVDHTTVEIATAADSGLQGGGDITLTRNLSVDIAGTTAETTIDEILDTVLINDASAGALRSMTIQDLTANKVSGPATSTDNAIARFDGTTGKIIQDSGVIIDDSDNVTIPGDLTVNGTTTSINTETLEVEDANITINNGGNQAAADLNDAGLTVSMTDATDVVIGYDSTTTSRMKLGDLGDEREIATVSHVQTLTNKTIDGTSATGTNTVTIDASDAAYDNSTSGLTATDAQAAIDEVEGRLDTTENTLANHLDGGPNKHDASEIDYERADGSKKNIQPTSDDAESAISDLDDAIGALPATPTNYTPADPTITADHLTGIDTELGNLQTQIDSKQNDVITTEGDLVIGDNTGEESRLGIGAADQVLQSDGTTASWQTLTLTDEKVKVSANDTTEKFLEDAITVSEGVNTTDILETSTLNEGGDEDFQIQIDETKIDHNVLTNYDANQHVDHTAVDIETLADSGLTGGGDISVTRSLSVDITNTTAETTIADTDELLIYDVSVGGLRKMTRADLFAGYITSSTADISETSFNFTNNQVAPADVTGLVFTAARGFEALLTIEVDASANVYETIKLEGIKRDSDWEVSQESIGDDTGLDFDVTAAGQVQYTSQNLSGFNSGTIKFRAITTTA